MNEAPAHFADVDPGLREAVGSFAVENEDAREALGSGVEAGDRSREARVGLGVEVVRIADGLGHERRPNREAMNVKRLCFPPDLRAAFRFLLVGAGSAASSRVERERSA